MFFLAHFKEIFFHIVDYLCLKGKFLSRYALFFEQTALRYLSLFVYLNIQIIKCTDSMYIVRNHRPQSLIISIVNCE